MRSRRVQGRNADPRVTGRSGARVRIPTVTAPVISRAALVVRARVTPPRAFRMHAPSATSIHTRRIVLLRFALLLCGCVALTAPAVAAPAASVPALPTTAPARRMTEMLALIQRGDRAGLLDYAQKHFVPDMLKPDPASIVDFLMEQHATVGGYDVRRVIQSSDEQITVLVQGRRDTDRWLRMVVGAEAAAPNRVKGLFFFPASAALAEGDDGPVPEAELGERLARIVDRLTADGDFSGTVCLTRDGRTLMSRAWGEANRRAHVRNTTATRFGIASLGKMFTAVAIARLVERGALHYDDRAADYVPDWLPPKAEEVTIAQLLTHTSGLGDYLEDITADRSHVYDRLDDYRGIARRDPPAFAPGSAFGYSNTGYVVLGAVIQKVTGSAWDEFLASDVFRPAGMTATSGRRPPIGTAGIATGYLKRDRAWIDNDSLLAGHGTPAGGGASTAEDLARFGNVLRDGTLLSKASFAILTGAHTEMTGTGMMYGYGFTVSRGEPGHRVYGHTGGFPGVSALLEVYEESGYVLAVLSNVDEGATRVGDAWRDLLRRREPGPPAK